MCGPGYWRFRYPAAPAIGASKTHLGATPFSIPASLLTQVSTVSVGAAMAEARARARARPSDPEVAGVEGPQQAWYVPRYIIDTNI